MGGGVGGGADSCVGASVYADVRASCTRLRIDITCMYATVDDCVCVLSFVPYKGADAWYLQHASCIRLCSMDTPCMIR